MPENPLTVDRSVLRHAIAAEYLTVNAKNLSITHENAESFADKVIESIPGYEDEADGRY